MRRDTGCPSAVRDVQANRRVARACSTSGEVARLHPGCRPTSRWTPASVCTSERPARPKGPGGAGQPYPIEPSVGKDTHLELSTDPATPGNPRRLADEGFYQFFWEVSAVSGSKQGVSRASVPPTRHKSPIRQTAPATSTMHPGIIQDWDTAVFSYVASKLATQRSPLHQGKGAGLNSKGFTSG